MYSAPANTIMPKRNNSSSAIGVIDNANEGALYCPVMVTNDIQFCSYLKNSATKVSKKDILTSLINNY